MPVKQLKLEQASFEEEINQKIEAAYQRIIDMNELLATGCYDSPYLPGSISLGKENLSEKIPVYKINVPGYFYRQHYRNGYTSKGSTGMLLATDPTNFVNNNSVMLYVVGSDTSGNGQLNNMCPILPGTSTYAFFPRDTSIWDGDETHELIFVPAVISASLNIHPRDYVTPVGTIDNKPLTASTNQPITSIFTGDWKTQFKTLCGWYVYDEGASSDSGYSKLKFVDDTAKTEFIKRRRQFILDFGLLPDYIQKKHPEYDLPDE